MKFKELEALNGIYRIYEDGSIESNIRQTKEKPWRAVKQQVTSKGYHRVSITLKKDGCSKTYRVHRLVAEAFLKPDADSSRVFVNHKDGNKDNNHYTNLEWCTHAENIRHAKLKGLMEKDHDVNGKAVRVVMEFPTARTAERMLGLRPDTVARLARGDTRELRTLPIISAEYIGEIK